jgi:hypothetical protein
MSWRYYEGAPGRRYCWAIDPTFTCPNGTLKYPTADDDWEIPEPFMRAAEILDMYPGLLLRMVVKAHRNNRRLRENGRLTDRCETCGRRMERKGFRAWAEEDAGAGRTGLQGVSDELTRAFGGKPSNILKVIYFDTKKEAVAWALEESRISRAVAAEAKGGSIDVK